MDRRSGRRARELAFAGLVACLVLLVAASGAQARRNHGDGSGGRHHPIRHLRGVVVHRNSHAGSFVVANTRGRLFAIHVAHSPALGSIVAVSLHGMHNRTYAVSLHRLRNGKLAPKLRAKGTSNHVRIHGTVSHVNGMTKTYVVSAEGVSMLVKSGRLAASLPPVGRLVTVTGTLDDENEGQVEEEDLQEEGEDPSGFDVEGTIVKIDTTARTLTVTAEDDQTENETVTVHVPTTIDISMFHEGEEVDLTVTPLSTGGFELVASSSDEGEQGADDGGDEQGEQGDDEEESEEQDQEGEDD